MSPEELNELIDQALVSDSQTGAVMLLAAHLRKMNNERNYLAHFWHSADFGPADTDVRIQIQNSYTGFVPETWVVK